MLVRQGHVETDKAEAGQQAEGFGQIGGPNVQRNVVAVDAVAPQPVPVQAGRAAVGDRIADHPGEEKGSFHPSISLRCIRMVRSSSRGKPWMLKRSPSICAKSRRPGPSIW